MTVVRAPRGSDLSCRGWPQEAALRMLMNNLDPEVAERPDDLVVYGGTGKAARSWDDYHRIVRELRRLGDDETLLVQSGRAVGVFRTHEEAPRVLLAWLFGTNTVLAVALQLLHELPEGRDRLARRRFAGDQGRGRQPSLAHRFGQQRIGQEPAAAGLRRHDLRHHPVAVGDQYGLAASGEADVLAELVLEHFQADRTHGQKCSYWKLPSSIASAVWHRTGADH